MPEYLTPGVYVEETSFRSRAIEGVPTATCGMAGVARYGPVAYVMPRTGGAADVVMVPRPTFVSSITEYERAFGGLEDVGDGVNYLGHAARAFFDNGGRRLYVSRVFDFARTGTPPVIDFTKNFGRLPIGPAPANPANPPPTWWARWPGAAGNDIAIRVGFARSRSVLVEVPARPGVPARKELRGLRAGAAVEIGTDPAAPPGPRVPPNTADVRIVRKDPNGGPDGFTGPNDTFVPLGTTAAAFHLTLTVSVRMGDRVDTYPGLELHGDHPRALEHVLRAEQPVDEFGLVWLDLRSAATVELLDALLTLTEWTPLTGGDDGLALTAVALNGEPSSPDDVKVAATGVAALGEIEDVAIVATPDAVRFGPAEHKTAVDDLIGHCEQERYRIAVVDPPADSSLSGVRAFRAQFDSSYAALYHPWLDVVDPTAKPDPSTPPALLALPPSGAAAGIYARSDADRGVHKAPANEVVRGIVRFRQNITGDRQAVLNPEGVNALRYFPGRSNRVWGARTMSSDPEWKYVNVRRLFIYLEHSIEKSTQWAVFEPNNERLWNSIRRTIEDFLLVTWRTGALMGTKPEEAYFVRCDRTTMTQNDLDNGRLICLVGVAPTYPAEFVIFRIGQWTADAPQT